jgi:hypothetical protein
LLVAGLRLHAITMTDAVHVKGYRLFDRSKAEVEEKDFRLLDWGEDHLRGCAECQELAVVFARLCKESPHLFRNGETSYQSGWYKNLCCGLEQFVIAGKTFPDCRRHKNLPTSWKLISEEDEARRTKSA